MIRIIESLGGRRYTMTMGAAFMGTGLCWAGKLSGGEFVTLISLTVAAYIAGNVGQRVTEIKTATVPKLTP